MAKVERKEAKKINKTQIEWVKNPDGSPGYTWNPITGCLNHVNGMCKGGGFPCYAYRLAHGRLKERYLANKNICNSYLQGIKDRLFFDPFYPRIWPERLIKLDRHNIPKAIGVFVCDMADLFGIGIPEEWTRRVLGCIEEQQMREYPDRFYLLTKQPQNLPKWSPFPDNCWVGVTATGQEQWNQAIYWLGYHVQAKVKFISVEPFLQPIHTTPILLYDFAKKENFINQIIIGAQTRPYKPPKIEWVEEIVRAADKAGVKVFLKDNLRPLLDRDLYWTRVIKSRQELPC